MPEWAKDLAMFFQNIQTLIRGKLYYNQKTRQYFDAEGKQLTYKQVADRFRFDPGDPQTLFAPSQAAGWITPRTQAIEAWVGAPLAPGGPMPTTPRPPELGIPVQAPTEQGEMEALAAQMGISVADLLRAQYNIPTSWQLEEQRRQQAWQQAEPERQRSLAYLQHMQERFQWQKQRDIMARQQFMGRAFPETVPSEAELERTQKMQMVQPWEDWRRRLVGELDRDRDWIRIQELESMPNPYQRREPSLTEEVATQRARLDLFKSQKSEIMRQMKEAGQTGEFVPATPQQAGLFGQLVNLTRQVDTSQRWIKAQEATPEYKQEAAQAGIAEVPSGGWGALPREQFEAAGGLLPMPPMEKPQPLTPTWLRGMYPWLPETMKWAQAPLGRTIAPPSAQAWTGLSPIQQQRWMGFTEFAGQRPEELLWQTARMLPRTPRTPGRWQPARQMA